MIKKIALVVCSVFVVSTLYAQFVTIDISQQVRRDISRLQTMNGDYSLKKEDVSKNITFTVKSSKYVKLLVLIFTSSGGDIKKEFVEGYATSTKLFEKTITPSPASSEEVRIAYAKYGWGSDYRRKSGDSKIMACVVVYNKSTGKFLGIKSTNSKFEKSVITHFKDDIAKYVKSHKSK